MAIVVYLVNLPQLLIQHSFIHSPNTELLIYMSCWRNTGQQDRQGPTFKELIL